MCVQRDWLLLTGIKPDLFAGNQIDSDTFKWVTRSLVYEIILNQKAEVRAVTYFYFFRPEIIIPQTL